MTRFALPVLILGILIAVLAVGLRRDPSYVPSPLIGKPAPDFTLPRLDDPANVIGKRDLLGDVSLVNVWATWCVACREEHPYLLELARTSGVRIYGLNWKDDPVLARQWLERLGNPYTATAMDQYGRVAIDWGVYGAPETFLLDPAGTVLYKHIAPLTPAIWDAEFLPRIRRARGEQP
jgi:cytochrome c biogenesis protein CcmG/thiol:disulfide interchange protein DsbE